MAFINANERHLTLIHLIYASFAKVGFISACLCLMENSVGATSLPFSAFSLSFFRFFRWYSMTLAVVEYALATTSCRRSNHRSMSSESKNTFRGLIYLAGSPCSLINRFNDETDLTPNEESFNNAPSLFRYAIIDTSKKCPITLVAGSWRVLLPLLVKHTTNDYRQDFCSFGMETEKVKKRS